MDKEISPPDSIRKTAFGKFKLDYETALRYEAAATVALDENYIQEIAKHYGAMRAAVSRKLQMTYLLSAILTLYVFGLIHEIGWGFLKNAHLTGFVEIATLLLSAIYSSVIFKLIEVFSFEALIKDFYKVKYENTFTVSFAPLRHLPNIISTEVFHPRIRGYRSTRFQSLTILAIYILMLVWMGLLFLFPAAAVVFGVEYSLRNPALPTPYSEILSYLALAVSSVMLLMFSLIFFVPFRFVGSGTVPPLATNETPSTN